MKMDMLEMNKMLSELCPMGNSSFIQSRRHKHYDSSNKANILVLDTASQIAISLVRVEVSLRGARLTTCAYTGYFNLQSAHLIRWRVL